MKKTFLIASTGDRADGLERLLISLFPFFQTGWHAVAVCQAYEQKDINRIRSIAGEHATIIEKASLIGAHSAKIIALNSRQSDVWCSLDDDMFAIPQTDYDYIADLLMSDKSIGFVSGNWARNAKLAAKKEKTDELIAQKLVFTGGGLLFRDDVAEIIRHIPDEQYLFDDCLWAMYAYIAGYNNFRTRNSIAVHQICTKGGRRTWLAARPDRVLPPPDLLRVRAGSNNGEKDGYNEYLICRDSDLTKKAHQLHAENRK